LNFFIDKPATPSHCFANHSSGAFNIFLFARAGTDLPCVGETAPNPTNRVTHRPFKRLDHVGCVLYLFCEQMEDTAMPDDDDLRFKIVRVNSHDEIVARACNLLIGRAAYETARRLYEGERVDYRDGARIISSSIRA
jgi:hypothetical protein